MNDKRTLLMYESVEEEKEQLCEMSCLEDVDMSTFHGTTGKIIKLRMRNFLNHENLELSFNSYKNIIIGKNGKGKSAIAQAVAVVLGRPGKDAGRDISLANYIKDYDQNKQNLTCYIEIFLSNSGDNSFKRDIYGDVIVIKRILTSHTNKFYLYGLRTSGENTMCTPSSLVIHNSGNNTPCDVFSSRKTCKKSYIDNYMNVIKLNIRSPCVYLDQEKGKQYFSNVSEKSLYNFFMNSVGLNLVEEEIEKEKELLQHCCDIIKEKEEMLLPQIDNIKNLKNRNDLLKREFQKLKIYDNNYKIVVFYSLLKSTILLFNEFLKSEHLKNEHVITSIENKMNHLINLSDSIKDYVKLIIERDTHVYNLIIKCLMKMEKYNSMLHDLDTLKIDYVKKKEDIVTYLNTFEKAKENRNLLQEHLNIYEKQIQTINDKIEFEVKKEKDLQDEINKKENCIYEMEYILNKTQNSIENISKKITSITMHANQIEKIKNNQMKQKMYIYGYDIYAVRRGILKNGAPTNEEGEKQGQEKQEGEKQGQEKQGQEKQGQEKQEGEKQRLEKQRLEKQRLEKQRLEENNPHYAQQGILPNYATNVKMLPSGCNMFKYEPIGPVGEYMTLRGGSVQNEKVLSIIEKHLGDLFYAWLVGCYEDKNKLSNVQLEGRYKLNIIVTNAFQHVRREKLLQNIQYLLNRIKGNSIYSFLNIDILPTPLLFYLHDHFKIAQTLICNDSTELQELLRTNDRKLINIIYVVDDFIMVRVLANGALHYQPSKEEYYKKSIFLKMSNESNNNPQSEKTQQVSPLNREDTTNDEQLQELNKKKKEMNEEYSVTSKKVLSYKNILYNLNESLKKCKFSQDELKYQFKNVNELVKNHNKIFTQQMDIEINEKNNDIEKINFNILEIQEYITLIEKKKIYISHLIKIHKMLISTHVCYLVKMKKEYSILVDEYNNLKEVLIKLEKDKMKNDEICSKNKKNFLLSLNKLHTIYFEYVNGNFSLTDDLVRSPFLVLKGRPSNVPITNVAIRKAGPKGGVAASTGSGDGGRTGGSDLRGDACVLMSMTVGEETVNTEIPLSCLNPFNKLFVLSKNDDEERLQNGEDAFRGTSNWSGKSREEDINHLLEMEECIRHVLSDTMRREGKPQEGTSQEGTSQKGGTSQKEGTSNDLFQDDHSDDDSKMDVGNAKFADYLWKKRCIKKKEIIELLKLHGFNEKDCTDNTIKNYYNSLIEQCINEEKCYQVQLRQIEDLKNNYDMHISNIKFRKLKFLKILKKTKKKISMHFKNILKKMNNYEGKIEFDDLKKSLKVMVSINQDMSKNIFMEISSLSGGERSTIQMALLASFSLTEMSAFHIFDELDVYMDELTRVKNMQQFCEFIERNNPKQYFFITPHIEITELFLEDAKEKKAKILRLS
ncbi:conserved Plasmodium protein, unknown function [Plasmodium ovale wallikeri]|uniref:Uncharacterized protein n=1 Tax=Plasmodium ovale wallikeri TaxID=864142 RepID=A0A1A8YWY9_PLAOA|nr:conserved Plasmodium protein, unknown function [Plasmodium ovale wallikeri]